MSASAPGWTAAALRASAERDPAPPPGLRPALEALWWCAHGDWERAHAVCQTGEAREGAWVHAHLHRVEGDEGNAGYWYRRAGRPPAHGDPEAEWAVIAAALLAVAD